MPIPGGEFKTEMLRGRKVSEISAKQTDDQEGRADDHMRAMEAGRHEECGAVDVATEIEPGVAVLVRLNAGECESKRDRENQTPLEPLPVVLQKRVMGPSYRRAGGEQDEGVEQGQMPGVERIE